MSLLHPYSSAVACLVLLLCTAFTQADQAFENDEDAKQVFVKGEHPRLFLSPDDVAPLRDRIKQEPYKSYVESMKKRVQDEKQWEISSSVLYDMRPRDLASLYLATGDKTYAEQAAKIVKEMLEDKVHWQNPKSKGLTRAAGALTIAWAYDLCFDAWPEEFRQRVSRELSEKADGIMASMGASANHNIGNNWQGVRYSSAGIAYLACDEPETRKRAAEAYDLLNRHLRANLGPSVWNPEGIGYTIYPWTFTGPFGIAARRAEIGDLRSDYQSTRLTLWTTLVGTVNIPTLDARGLRADLSDDHPRYMGRGTAGLAFWYTPAEKLPAVKWMVDYLYPKPEERDNSWGGALYQLLLYPNEIEAKNPSEMTGLTFEDRPHGIAIFRNRYENENDIVALVNAAGRRPMGAHAGPDTNTIRIMGLGSVFVTGGGRTSHPAGQTNLFADRQPPARGIGGTGQLVESMFDKDGSGKAVVTGSVLGVDDQKRVFMADYSQAAGVPALFVNTDTSENGKLWRLNTPEFNQIEIEGNNFFLIAPNGATLRVTILEPKKVQFRTGEVERGGGAGHIAFPYRGKKYINNKFIEFDIDGRAAVVMTLTKDKPQALNVEQSLHGARTKIGKIPVLFDRNLARTLVGEDAAKSDAMTRKVPLTPRRPKATVVGDRAVRIQWQDMPLGAENILIQRRQVGTADSQWSTVATLEASTSKFIDRKLEPKTGYEYQILTRNESGLSKPAELPKVVTWADGFSEWVEDFAPSKVNSENRMGDWNMIKAQSHNIDLSNQEGSQRSADAKVGMLVTGYVPIRMNRAIINEDIQVDLSGDASHVSFDIQAQATTVFSPVFKLANDQWVMCGRTYVSSPHAWQTLEYDLHAPNLKWWSVDPKTLKRGNEEIKVTRDMLKDVRGVGIFVEWVINQKWIKIDQYHLRGQNITLRKNE